MITCTSYKEGNKTFYNIQLNDNGTDVSITREIVGTLSRAEFLACIEGLELAKSFKWKKGFPVYVTSKAVLIHSKDVSSLTRSELFRAACVLHLLIEETGAKIILQNSH